MVFSSYEELAQAVEDRRKSVLTLEVPVVVPYSVEHENAKKELKNAEAMKALSGGAGFLGDNLDSLRAKVAGTQPETTNVWIQYNRLSLEEWSLLIKQQNLTPLDQYERILPKTFIAVYGVDPVRPDDLDEFEVWAAPEPLSTDAELLSSRSPKAILPGSTLNQVVQAFMAWQNSGGDVSIRPTKSGRV